MKPFRVLWAVLALAGIGIMVPFWLEMRADKQKELSATLAGNKTIMLDVCEGIEAYYKEYGVMPTSATLLMRDDKIGLRWITGTNDVWGRPLVFQLSSKGAHIISLGADGKEGGNGVDADCSMSVSEEKLNALWITPTTCTDSQKVETIREFVLRKHLAEDRFKNRIEVHGPLPRFNIEKGNVKCQVPDVLDSPNWKRVLKVDGEIGITADLLFGFPLYYKAFKNTWEDKDEIYGVVLRATRETVGGFSCYLHVRSNQVIGVMWHAIIN
jgi:hypothetical protein